MVEVEGDHPLEFSAAIRVGAVVAAHVPGQAGLQLRGDLADEACLRRSSPSE